MKFDIFFQELSGLGQRKKINYPEIDFRYQYMAEVARKYAVVSLGLSCFTCKSVSNLKIESNEGMLLFPVFSVFNERLKGNI